ncbi:MAG: TIM barrel protein [Actinomycetia bacterium]|nr:TIM barrel protein [Actinomycetes bacterium]
MRLSICAETFFSDLPLPRRAERIAAAGFLVDFWSWYDKADEDLEALAADPAVEIGAITGGLGGSLVHPDDLERYLDGVRRGLQVARRLGCRELVLEPGEQTSEGRIAHAIAEHPVTRWVTAYKGLCEIAELAEQHEVVYHLEHLNTKVDHAGTPLPLVEDAVRLVEEVGSPRLKVLLDIYHVQVEEGNIIQVILDFADHIGLVHVADVPGRHEIGTGEINYPQVVKALREIGYEGIVGYEAFPIGDQDAIMARFRELFSTPAAA